MGLRRVFASFEDGSVSCFPTAASCFVCTKSTFNQGQTSTRARRPEQRSRQWDQWRNEQAGSEQRRPENSGLPSRLPYDWHLRWNPVCGDMWKWQKVEIECPEEGIDINGSTA